MSKTKRKVKSYSLLFQNFAGQFVTFAVKNIKASGGRPGKVINVMVAGILLDEDDEYFFLGRDGEEIYAAISKDEVASVMLADEVTELMDSIEVPPGTEVQ